MRLPSDSIPSSVFSARRARLAEVLAARKLDAYFFSGISDLYYLTGFHSEGFYGLVGAKKTWLFSSALLAGQVRENAPGCVLIVGKRLTLALEALRAKHGLRRVGFDGEQLNFRLGDLLQKKGLTAAPNPLEELRVIKDDAELERLRRAGQITAEAVEHVKKRVKAGMTEKQMAVAIENYFYRRGATGIGFDLIAAVGPNTALPHHIPGETRLTRNSPVLFDVGCRVGAYRSDLTRSFYYGKITPSYKRVYGIVDAAQKAGIGTIRPGATGGQVDAAARSVIARAGYGRTFIHSTGHGVGVDIHEPPWVRPKSPDLLKPNMILTVEPGIYLSGRFGVRIEDTLRVTADGRETLTHT